MKTTLIILFLIALLLAIAIEAYATLCIEDVATGKIWCDPGSPVSPVAVPPQRIYLPVIRW